MTIEQAYNDLPLYYIGPEEAYAKAMSGEWSREQFLEWYEDCRQEARQDGYGDGYANAESCYDEDC